MALQNVASTIPTKTGSKKRLQNLWRVCVVALLLSSPTRVTAAGQALVPATPQDFVTLYAVASAAMSAEAVASFYHEEVTSIPFAGPSRVMRGNAQQQEELQGLFDSLASRGIASLILADYSITQLSDHFATTRLRWELSQADGKTVNVINSTYVIRREDSGWRVVTILEMGKPHGL
ncbi:MAG: DUF4440 domain-containing protein [Rhodospirillaceae bacterium]